MQPSVDPAAKTVNGDDQVRPPAPARAIVDAGFIQQHPHPKDPDHIFARERGIARNVHRDPPDRPVRQSAGQQPL
jgi:hypothetical protein